MMQGSSPFLSRRRGRSVGWRLVAPCCYARRGTPRSRRFNGLRAMTMSEIRHRVVVVGGGFGGLQAALHLAGAPVDVTLIDRRNFHLFQPLAYQVATGALSPAEICFPLRRIFRRRPNVEVMLAEVTDFDLDTREVRLAPVAGSVAPASVPYDTLVVSGGSRYSYFGHDEWQDAAPEL